MIDKKQIINYAARQIKKQFMSDEIKQEKSSHADSVIRNHMLIAMGVGFIPLPLMDVLAAGAVQLDMIRQLCKVYDVEFKENQGKAVISALTTSILTKMGVRSALKLIPGVGTIIGGLTLAMFNGASTYALGEVFKKHFELGGTILDFDVERVRKAYKEKFEKGKKIAEDLKREEEAKKAATAAPKGDPEPVAADQSQVIARIKQLAEMKEQGIISPEEFEQMKKKLIEEF
ncbi:MAG TPA: DUF697 domain-containing protein [Saprospiraceae bacterium]|jgi:uncharacterized protein (DUF697 family)|nr:DUF697 domain-containing protein [Saprospiraceae bacterium]HMP13311.1 DUF697 domain-containing protein [Saprospiraceae bacterium]